MLGSLILLQSLNRRELLESASLALHTEPADRFCMAALSAIGEGGSFILVWVQRNYVARRVVQSADGADCRPSTCSIARWRGSSDSFNDRTQMVDSVLTSSWLRFATEVCTGCDMRERMRPVATKEKGGEDDSIESGQIGLLLSGVTLLGYVCPFQTRQEV